MNSIVAGAGTGLLMASLFLSVGAVMLFVHLRERPAGPPELPDDFSPTKAALSAVAAAYPAWGILGAVLGLLFDVSVEHIPGGGLGSPNVVFTLSMVVAAALAAVPYVLLMRRMALGVLLMAAGFAALFGWFLPLMAS